MGLTQKEKIPIISHVILGNQVIYGQNSVWVGSKDLGKS